MDPFKYPDTPASNPDDSNRSRAKNAAKRKRKAIANGKPVCGHTRPSNVVPFTPKPRDLSDPRVVIRLVTQAIGNAYARRVVASEYRAGRKELAERAMVKLTTLEPRIDHATANTLILASIGIET